jgi:hypothetical protein
MENPTPDDDHEGEYMSSIYTYEILRTIKKRRTIEKWMKLEKIKCRIQ